MKKIAKIILLTIPFLLSSCLIEQEDFFDQTASERMEAAKAEAKKVLEGAENGWHVRYFPNPNQAFGGYNLFFKFADGKITICSEIDNASKTETSLYSMGEDLGPTVNFDTKNSLINYFVHPKNPDGIGSNYKGMEGDYQFTVMSATPEEVILRGIKSENKYVLTPLAAGVDWTEEMQMYKDNAEDMEFTSYSCVVKDKTYDMSLSYRLFKITLDVDNNVSAPFIYTKTGISFYQPITIDGVTVKDLNFVDEYYFAAADGADFKIMTPEPVRSDITFTAKVPEDKKTYKSVEVAVTPSKDTEYYYIGVMLKSEFEAEREKKILAKLVSDINMNVSGTTTAEEVAENLLFKGAASYQFDYPSFYDDYVAVTFGCAISDGAIVATTKMTTVPFTVDASLLPENTNPDYKRWLGKWAVTSATSETTGTPYTFYITIKPNVINSSYKIRGWGYTIYANSVDIAATYSAGKLRVTGNQANLATLPDGTLYLANRYVTDAGAYGILNSTNVANLAATYDGDGKATMTGRKGTLSGGVSFQISGLELYRRVEGSSSYYYLTVGSGFISLDYFVGPYSMVQTVDPDGNTLAPAKATAAAYPMICEGGTTLSGCERCTASE